MPGSEHHKHITFLKQAVVDAKQEASRLRAENDELKRQYRRNMRNMREMKDHLATLHSSISFQLGHALVSAVSSWRGLGAFPVTIGRIGVRGMKLALKSLGFNEREPDVETGRGLPAPCGATVPEVTITMEGSRSGSCDDVVSNEGPSGIPSIDMRGRSTRTLSIAGIVDDFTFACLEPECAFYQLTPPEWQAGLEQSRPDLLFVESAWRGKDNSWGGRLAHRSREVLEILDWCRDRHIPTVFWNKEDPIHFGSFLSLAQLFDYVFTTDIDCIQRYKAALRHERVYLLPFACQPTIHNPVELDQRSDAVCFAGSYYKDLSERSRDLENFVMELPGFRPIEIYDRNYGAKNVEFRFPDKYRPYIIGNLPFSNIDKAYKGYSYGINLNTIKQSQTMFARRVFELLASNTITVSNFSRGLRLLFGDLVLATDSGEELTRRLQRLIDGSADDERIRLTALRKVLLEHTYSHRLAYIASKVSGEPVHQDLPTIRIIAPVKTPDDVENVGSHLARQKNVEPKVTVVLCESSWNPGPENVSASFNGAAHVVTEAELSGCSLADLGQGSDWLAALWPQDYYGPHYLVDLVLAAQYSRAPVIGKAAYHVLSSGGVNAHFPDRAYRPAAMLPARRAAIKRVAAEDIAAREWIRHLPDWRYDHPNQLGIDSFNYCEDGAAAESADVIADAVDDISVNGGVGVDELLARAEKMAPLEPEPVALPALDAAQLAVCFGEQGAEAVKTRLSDRGWEIVSTLPDGAHEHLYAKTFVSLDEVLGDRPCATEISFYLDMEPGLNALLVVSFLDTYEKVIDSVTKLPNHNHTVEIPVESEYIRLGLRVAGGGRAFIRRFFLGHLDLAPTEIITRSDVLLVTDTYPSYEAPYRNSLVHERVLAYKKHGVDIDVFVLEEKGSLYFREYENVDIISGGSKTLRRCLETGSFQQILAHSFDEHMWQVLREFTGRIRTTVWLGHQVLVRQNTGDNNSDESESRAGDEHSLNSSPRSILGGSIPGNVHFVFDSEKTYARFVNKLTCPLPTSRCRILPTPVNPRLFTFQQKRAEQRRKILYVMGAHGSDPDVARVDYTVLRELSKKRQLFGELELLIVGDTESMMGETRELVGGLDNVRVETQNPAPPEVAKVYREYGVFIRMAPYDWGGYLLHEAMAAGMVPVVNDEDLESGWGVPINSDRPSQVTEAIEALCCDPARFLSTSKAAVEHVQQVAGMNVVAERELAFFKGSPAG